MREDYIERNRRSWEAAVEAHESHRPGLAEFLQSGGSTLFPEERRLLGEVSGGSLAHLMCNTGGDSLSLAALGASVTGVDLGRGAIERARRLSRESGIQADFVCGEVCEWLEHQEGCFDVVFGSYGVICWLEDLGRWARGVAGALRPGGRMALVDFHPAAATLKPNWRLAGNYPRDGEAVDLSEGVGDYVGASGEGLVPSGFEAGMAAFSNPVPCRIFGWGLGEVVSAICEAGLRLEALEEYSHINGERQFTAMVEGEGRRLYPPEGVPRLPLMYGLAARRG